jgi:geranylgeranyl pyrophosphate synthase
LQYTEALAVAEIDKATACLEKLPSSVYKDAMHDLARYSINREY